MMVSLDTSTRILIYFIDKHEVLLLHSVLNLILQKADSGPMAYV